MFRPLVCLPCLALVLLLQAPTTSGTFAISLTSAAGVSLLALTAPQVSTIAAVAVLAKLAGVAKLWALSQRRGKRSAEEEEEVPSLEMLATLEVEDCYKRVICSASSGEVTNPRVRSVLNLFNPVQFMRAPLTHKAMKFVEAARYGQGRGVAKCEHRYQCSLGMEVLQDMF
jgi:hypothetical protein